LKIQKKVFYLCDHRFYVSTVAQSVVIHFILIRVLLLEIVTSFAISFLNLKIFRDLEYIIIVLSNRFPVIDIRTE
jgi:hypothetical protein